MSDFFFQEKKTSKELIRKWASRRYFKEFDSIPDRLLEDETFINAVIPKNPSLYLHIPKNLQLQKSIAMLTVKNKGILLEYLPECFKNDKNVVMEAVLSDPKALIYASNHQRDNKKIVIAAMMQKSNMYFHASKRLKEDEEIALLAVSKSFQFSPFSLPPSLKTNRSFLLKAIPYNSDLFNILDYGMQCDEEIIIQTLRSDPSSMNSVFHNGVLSKKLSYIAIKAKGLSYNRLRKSYRYNEKFMLTAIRKDFRVFCAIEYERRSKKITLKAIQKHPPYIESCERKVRMDRQLRIVSSISGYRNLFIL